MRGGEGKRMRGGGAERGGSGAGREEIGKDEEIGRGVGMTGIDMVVPCT